MISKTAAWVFGAAFTLIGLLGFIGTPLVGGAGYFETNLAHDIIHFVIGLALIAVAVGAEERSATALRVFGAIYVIVAVLGWLMAGSSGTVLGFIQANAADHVLHVIAGLVMLAIPGLAHEPTTRHEHRMA